VTNKDIIITYQEKNNQSDNNNIQTIKYNNLINNSYRIHIMNFQIIMNQRMYNKTVTFSKYMECFFVEYVKT
jgi:hypothetical protein